MPDLETCITHQWKLSHTQRLFLLRKALLSLKELKEVLKDARSSIMVELLNQMVDLEELYLELERFWWKTHPSI